jgi:hypothetical protein
MEPDPVSLKIAFPTTVPRRSTQMQVVSADSPSTLVSPSWNNIPLKVVRHEVGDSKLMSKTRDHFNFSEIEEPRILYAEGSEAFVTPLVLDVSAPDAKRKLNAANGCSALIEPGTAVTIKTSGWGIMFEVVFY